MKSRYTYDVIDRVLQVESLIIHSRAEARRTRHFRGLTIAALAMGGVAVVMAGRSLKASNSTSARFTSKRSGADSPGRRRG